MKHEKSYNHMHFFRYLFVFTIHSDVSFPLIVLIHVNCSFQTILFLIIGSSSYLLCTVYVSNHHCSQFLLT